MPTETGGAPGPNEFRLWVRLVKDNRLLKDVVIEDNSDSGRTIKIKKAVDEACGMFDLPRPIWLKATIDEFRDHDRCRFTGDAFIEGVPFDYMEIRVI